MILEYSVLFHIFIEWSVLLNYSWELVPQLKFLVLHSFQPLMSISTTTFTLTQDVMMSWQP